MAKEKQGFCTRKSGENVAKLFMRGSFRDDCNALEELVCNSYDADALRADIHFEPDKNSLEIRDNGRGMDQKGLDSFYMVGDSEKINEKDEENIIKIMTEGGRIPIGDRGLGALGTAYLANWYRLETVRDGKKLIVEEDVSKGVGKCSKRIPWTEKKAPKEEHGTCIFMKGLKAFKEGRELTLAGIMHGISNNMPLSPDFEVYVNGKKIIPRKIENATEYFFDVDTKYAGRVSGSFFLCSSTIPEKRERGIFIRVNKRVVGDPNYFNLPSFKNAFGTKLAAFINADGLDKCIGVDRSRFETGKREFRGVEEIIIKVLKSMRMDYDNDTESAAVEKNQKIMEIRLKNIKEKFRLDNIKFETKGQILSQLDKRDVYINPSAIMAKSLHDPELAYEIENAVLFAIAKQRIGNQKTSKDLERYFVEKKASVRKGGKTLAQLLNENRKTDGKKSLNEYRLYTDTEMEDLRGVSYLITRRLMKCGELREIKPEKFLARDFVDCIKKMEGYVSVYEIIRNMVEDEGGRDERDLSLNITATEQQVVEQMQNYKDLPNYVSMLGKSETPFYIVEKNHVKDFEKLLESKALYRRKGRKPSAHEAQQNKEPTIDNLAETSDVPETEKPQIEKIIESLAEEEKGIEMLDEEPGGDEDITTETITPNYFDRKPEKITPGEKMKIPKNGRGWCPENPINYDCRNNYKAGMWIRAPDEKIKMITEITGKTRFRTSDGREYSMDSE